MKNLVLVWFVLVLAASCGDSRQQQHPCGAMTCDGCCTASGVCVDGDEKAACGIEGAACTSCPPGQLCNTEIGMCGRCGPDSCNGCCTGAASDDCRPGITLSQCGFGGNACASCGALQSCWLGVCR